MTGTALRKFHEQAPVLWASDGEATHDQPGRWATSWSLLEQSPAMTLPERPLSYRAQDDEDHRLALCGLTPDERSDVELEDFYSRHSDFIFTQGPGYDYWVNGGGPACHA